VLRRRGLTITYVEQKRKPSIKLSLELRRVLTQYLQLWQCTTMSIAKPIFKRGDRLQQNNTIAPVRKWVESLVVGMNLCPFAKRELVNDRVRFTVTEASSEEALLTSLQAELALLVGNPAIETTLLIHPEILQDFHAYNQFLNYVDELLVQMQLEGVIQVASFHPDYQFGGTEPDDAENYTNRSPYPLLHLLRETSIERAASEHPDVSQIPVRNIELMNSTGKDKLQVLIDACFSGA
jgi:hypothetical protein